MPLLLSEERLRRAFVKSLCVTALDVNPETFARSIRTKPDGLEPNRIRRCDWFLPPVGPKTGRALERCSSGALPGPACFILLTANSLLNSARWDQPLTPASSTSRRRFVAE